MKKTILFTFLMLLSITFYGQDSSNDATWEETIDFILKYKDQKEVIITLSFPSKGGQNAWFKTTSFNIINNQLILNMEDEWDSVDSYKDREERTSEFTYYKLPSQITIPLIYLKNSSYNKITLALTKDFKIKCKSKTKLLKRDRYYNIKTTTNYNDDVLVNFNSIEPWLESNDSEFNNRINKAFKHLRFLAQKKREEQRKASGDKF